MSDQVGNQIVGFLMMRLTIFSSFFADAQAYLHIWCEQFCHDNVYMVYKILIILIITKELNYKTVPNCKQCRNYLDQPLREGCSPIIFIHMGLPDTKKSEVYGNLR